jgi:ribonucleoside-diphosphate reductase alpha chain
MQAWKLGLKAVAIYRDGCKKSQPLVLSKEVKEKTEALIAAKVKTAEALAAGADENLNGPPRAKRNKMPDERLSVTHKFSIAGHDGYITVGLYPGGDPGEIFITMAKEGSTVSGLMDSFALAVSIALQHGVPLKLLCEKFEHTRFEPSGWSQNSDIGYAKSIMDYIFRWLHLRFLTGQQQMLFDSMRPKSPVVDHGPAENGGLGLNGSAALPAPASPGAQASRETGSRKLETGHVADALKDLVDLGDAPSCSTCGSIMVRNGSCYKCMSCGSTSGCS